MGKLRSLQIHMHIHTYIHANKCVCVFSGIVQKLGTKDVREALKSLHLFRCVSGWQMAWPNYTLQMYECAMSVCVCAVIIAVLFVLSSVCRMNI